MTEFVFRIFVEAWRTLVESGPYLLFGFLAAGLVHGLVTEDTVATHLGAGRVSSVVKAALFGIPLPLCSCGVLPAASNLRKRGASRGAMVAFLISTPETGADSLALSYALLGPVMTLFRPIAALLTAVIAGTAENFAHPSAEKKAKLPMASASCGCGLAAPGKAGLGAKLREGLGFAFGDLFRDLAPWLGVGFLVAGVIGAAMPSDLLERFLGRGPLSYLAMLVLGIPLYVCATASTPIAASLILKGLSPGAALVFLLAGPATNAATIAALGRLLGVRSTVRYVATIALVAVGMGVATDLLHQSFGLSVRSALGSAGELPAIVGQLAALLLIALALFPYLRGLWAHPPAPCPGAT